MNKPIILAGAGCLSCRDEFMAFVNRVKAPVLLTWKAIGLLPDDHPLYCGRPGTIGQYAANRILQECDYLLVLGAKMDKDQTAYQLDKIAPLAYKLVIDIDEAELRKYPSDGTWEIYNTSVENYLLNFNKIIITSASWLLDCQVMYKSHPVINPDWWNEDEVNYYCFIDELTRLARATDVISPECSNSAPALFQSWRVKDGQELTYAGALGAMGSGLPGAIGAAFATDRRVITVMGDGGFTLNMQELEVVKRHNLPIKIFVIDNGGYGAIMSTQRAYFDGRFVGCNKESGLTLPNIKHVAQAFDLQTWNIDKNDDIPFVLNLVMKSDQPEVVIVKLRDDFKPVHMVKKIMVDGVPTTGAFDDI